MVFNSPILDCFQFSVYKAMREDSVEARWVAKGAVKGKLYESIAY